jgi:chromosome partitioning protein
MKVIAIANQKGGVGKTTLTREIAACCAQRGYQVLMVDCDPQGNLTDSWIDSNIMSGTLAHVMLEPETLSGGAKTHPMELDDTIIETSIPNLDLVPADIRLARFEQQPNYMDHRLRKQLTKHAQIYDLVFIDCPPQLGKLLTAALYATEYVIIPCAADAMGLPGLADLSYTIEQIKENVNSDLKIVGAIINLFKRRSLSVEARTAIESATEHVKHVFSTNIHDYAKIAEAPSHKLPVTIYSPTHKSADQVWDLTEEILDKLKISRQKMTAVK